MAESRSSEPTEMRKLVHAENLVTSPSARAA
jgi:hypothetical protein